MRKIYGLILCAVLAMSMLALSGCDKLLSIGSATQSSKSGQSDIADNSFVVSFDTDGGSEIASQSIKDGRKARVPAQPKKEGYTFEGWYYNDEKWSFTQNVVTEDITLVARWSANENVIVFNPNGASGEMSNLKCLVGQTVTLTQNQFTYPGYTFLGWSTAANGTVEYIDGAEYEMGTAQINELYAVWSTDDYVITYEVYGGDNSGNTKFSFTTPDLPITLKAPIKDGCTFAGWYTSESFDGEAVTKITEPKNTQLYAKFIDGTSGLEYEIHDDYVEVKGYNGSDTSVFVPEYYGGGLPVSVIGEASFWKCNELVSVTLSSRVLTIERNAFKECTSLSSIEIGENLVNIEYGAFYGCTSLKSFNAPKRVEEIGISAFEGCTLLESVTLTDAVTHIGEAAFKDCTSLKSIVIPNGVKTIDGSAFYNCSSATELVIGQGVEVIGDSAFEGCVLIEEIVIPDSVTAVGESLFRGCTALHTVAISDQMTIINSFTFENCTSLKNIKMGENVEEIYDYAFNGCDSIEMFTLAGKIESIGRYAFGSCDSLVGITIGDNLTTLGEYAFRDCKKLETINFGKGLTTISNYAFGGCSALKEIVVPEGVEKIDKYAFAYCTSITRIVVPKTVSEIGERAMYSCAALESIEVSEENTSFKTINGSLYTKNASELIQYAIGKKDTSFTVPSGVSAIADRAFYGCTYLEEVTIGTDVTSIGRYAFEGCVGIKSVVLENPNGWWYTSKATATSGTSIDASEMENSQSAAYYLAQNYTNYYWKRS